MNTNAMTWVTNLFFTHFLNKLINLSQVTVCDLLLKFAILNLFLVIRSPSARVLNLL